MSDQNKLSLGVILGSLAIISWKFWPTLLYFFATWNENQKYPLVLVRSTQGDAIGVSVNEGAIFRGIPYSQPPTGRYRWRHPRNFTSFPNNRWNATYYRSACMQICDQPATFYACPQTKISEDCLYLNVWVPRRALHLVKGDDVIRADHYVISDEFLHNDNASFAVMLFIHGGHYLDGAGSAPIYDSRNLANFGDVIVVTINYRLGPWGYLVYGNLEGNFGLLDQIKALSWVKTHIQPYGGNSNKITVFGQSAGAQSIAILLTSPVGKVRFNQAIMQSTYLGDPFPDIASSKRQGNKFIQTLGCPSFDVACLKNVSSEDIMRAYVATKDSIAWGPVIGGNFLPKQPMDAFLSGDVKDMPIIMGGTVDESTMFIADDIPHVLTDIEYDELLMDAFKLKHYFSVRRRYPPACPLFDYPIPPCDNRPELSKLMTDYVFLCPQRKVLQHLNFTSKWFYIFNQTWSFYEAWELPQCFDHVCHSADLVYVFNANQSIFSLNPTEKKLSQRIQKYWTNFARFGNPNGYATEELPENIKWPKFSPERNSQTYKALQFRGMGDEIMKSPYNSNCNFWDEIK